MRTALLVPFVLAACQGPGSAPRASAAHAPSKAADAAFGARFTGATLRFDYVHCGTAKEEHVAPAGFRIEGEWPGSHTHLVDDTDLGKYRFRVFDAATKTELFSRGFASIYGEWETTGPAKEGWGSCEESQRFPEPRSKATLTLEKRGDDGAFHELWRGDVDPKGRFVDRSALPKVGEVLPIRENGPAANHVDLLVVADGYTAEKRGKFLADVKRLTDVLLATEPFRRNASAFNVRALFVPTPESGISNPRKGVWKDGAFGLAFNAFDSDRYVLTYEDRKLRDAAAQAPYDALILLFDERKYGGGGIYNLWATCASDTEPAPYVFVHEFGHSFAGLADEYYSSQVAYESTGEHDVEPWEPNVTALLDPSKLKWKDLVEAATPLPTPWDQKRYDELDLAYQKERKALIDAKASEEASEVLMRSIQTKTAPLLRSERFFGKVGAFEGAMYEAKGLYRPEADCIMFTRNPTSFCKVCERAIERVLRRFTE